MTSVAAYCRVSSKAQTLTPQRSAIERCAAARGDTVGTWYAEKVSGGRLDRPELHRLTVPSLIVHGGRDEIVRPDHADLFDDVPSAEVVVMPESRHFPFLDEAELFNDTLLRFLKQDLPRTMPRVRARQSQLARN